MSSQLAPNHKIARMLRIERSLTVYNKSGKDAKVFITPCPIKRIKAVGLERLGHIEVELDGDYLTQEMFIKDGGEYTFTLDNSQVYYTTLFKTNTGKTNKTHPNKTNAEEWMIHRKNIKLDASRYDFVLLPRHANDLEHIF